jgi:hypothetical protein
MKRDSNYVIHHSIFLPGKKLFERLEDLLSQRESAQSLLRITAERKYCFERTDRWICVCIVHKDGRIYISMYVLRTDGRMDRQTDKCTYGQTNVRLYIRTEVGPRFFSPRSRGPLPRLQLCALFQTLSFVLLHWCSCAPSFLRFYFHTPGILSCLCFRATDILLRPCFHTPGLGLLFRHFFLILQTMKWYKKVGRFTTFCLVSQVEN